MSHYHVNASVPKTLVQYLIRWTAETGQLGHETSKVLQDVVNTVISPELVPRKTGEHSTQKSEDVIGPYELQDFNLYYLLRFGYPPPKVAFLAWSNWRDRKEGSWPDIPEQARHEYNIGEIKRWLAIFLERFFKYSQFKRSCIPNSPKVGSGGSLSPRGDYRAPSDAEAAVWLSQLKEIPDQETDEP
jgi:NAD+ synthase (glutamine-hydrolysing)